MIVDRFFLIFGWNLQLQGLAKSTQIEYWVTSEVLSFSLICWDREKCSLIPVFIQIILHLLFRPTSFNMVPQVSAIRIYWFVNFDWGTCVTSETKLREGNVFTDPVCSHGGGWVGASWDRSHGSVIPRHQTWGLTPPHSPTPTLLLTSGGHHRRPVQTCSLRTYPPAHWYWHLVVATEWVVRILLECCLVANSVYFWNLI